MESERAKQLIHLHLENQITAEERLELKEYLKDEACREYLEQAKLANKIIEIGKKKTIEDEESGEDEDISQEEIENDIRRYRNAQTTDTVEFVKNLDRAYQRSMNRKSGKKRRLVLLISIAAIILLALVLSVFIRDPSPAKFYYTYYEKYHFEVFRGDHLQESAESRILQNYNSGGYQESIILASDFLEQQPQNTEGRLLYALSLQETGMINQAIDEYQKIIEQAKGEDGRIYPLASWYLGLSYLHEGEIAKARQYLEVARYEGGIFVDRERVEELLERM